MSAASECDGRQHNRHGWCRSVDVPDIDGIKTDIAPQMPVEIAKSA
ncbi:MAG TPA: hypothetical protein VJR58_25735 [Vineibacter sp.]|nr:hypothetical protein [Vineibacter sp.]